MALTSGDELDLICEKLSEQLNDDTPFVLAGIGQSESPASGKESPPGENLAVLKMRLDPSSDWKENGLKPIWSEQIQLKHHRWLVNRDQARQYGIENSFKSHLRSWEHTAVDERFLHFSPFRKGMLFTFVICEDLARQEPAPRLIRAVGPNLLIALLMDGPQLLNRWSARYASVFADDPGCSVLSMTSAGIVDLSNQERQNMVVQGDEPEQGGRVVGLWRDPVNGCIELSLPEGDNAILIQAKCEQHEHYALDGRHKYVTIYTLDKDHVTPLSSQDETQKNKKDQ